MVKNRPWLPFGGFCLQDDGSLRLYIGAQILLIKIFVKQLYQRLFLIDVLIHTNIQR